MDYPSREELLVLKKKISFEPNPLWPGLQLWIMDIPKPSIAVYRHLYGTQSNDESLFTPIFEVYAEWAGETLMVQSYRYHNHPQMDLIDPHNPIEALVKVDMEDIWE